MELDQQGVDVVESTLSHFALRRRTNKKSIHDGREADGFSPIISSNQSNVFM